MKKSRSNLLLFIVICVVIGGMLEWVRYSQVGSSQSVHSAESVEGETDYAEPETTALQVKSLEIQAVHLVLVCSVIFICFVPCIVIAKRKNMFVLSNSARERKDENKAVIKTEKVEIGA